MCRPYGTRMIPKMDTLKQLEEVEEFGSWWITEDRRIQLARDLSVPKNFTRQEAEEIVPQVRETGWSHQERELRKKYSLVKCGGNEFYVLMQELPFRRISVEQPLLEDLTYRRTSDPSQIIESERSLLDY